jgi:uncharacterized MAPEG superfamily protein
MTPAISLIWLTGILGMVALFVGAAAWGDE